MTMTKFQFTKEWQKQLAASNHQTFRMVLLMDGELFFTDPKTSKRGIEKLVEHFDIAFFPHIYAIQGKGLYDTSWTPLVYGPASDGSMYV